MHTIQKLYRVLKKKMKMKRNYFLYLLALLFLSCVSYDGGETPDPSVTTQIDITTTCRSAQESGNYATLYKPQAG